MKHLAPGTVLEHTFPQDTLNPFFFFSVLGMELKTLHMLGYHGSCPLSPYPFSEMGCCYVSQAELELTVAQVILLPQPPE
jgi:hypothetical protein